MEGDNIIGMFDVTGGGAISLEPGGQFELSGAPVDNRAPDRRRIDGASRAIARSGAPARHRLPRHRHDAELEPRRHAGDAEGPLQDHDQLHAEGRHARPRHDVPHLHGAGEPRLLLRSRHGQEAARVAGAAAGGDRAVRQFAVHRRQAERLPLVPLADLDRHRQPARRHAAFRLRGRHGLRALRRLRARRADVFRQARRQIHRRRRASRSAISSPASSTRCRASGRPSRTGPITSARFSPRCGSSAISRCAAPTAGRGGGCRRSPPIGSACSTTRTRSTPAGTWSRTGARRSARPCATRCRSAASAPRSATATCSRWRRRRCGCRARGLSGARGSTATAATRRAICGRWKRSIARGITPAEELLEKYFNDWNDSVEPLFEEYAY